MVKKIKNQKRAKPQKTGEKKPAKKIVAKKIKKKKPVAKKVVKKVKKKLAKKRVVSRSKNSVKKTSSHSKAEKKPVKASTGIKSKKQKASIGYKQISGSELRRSSNLAFSHYAGQTEILRVTIIMRRRLDGEPLPDMNYYINIPSWVRKSLTQEEFTKKYGAAPSEMNTIVKCMKEYGLKITETNAAQRKIVVTGTVAQMNKAFGVTLAYYTKTTTEEKKERTEVYRGYEGRIHTHKSITGFIMSVFGLDNKKVFKHQSRKNIHTHKTNDTVQPDYTRTLYVPDVTKFYNFPQKPATGQTIVLLATLVNELSHLAVGYNPADIDSYYKNLNVRYPGYVKPQIQSIVLNNDLTPYELATNKNGVYPEIEITIDICIASTVAQGANIVIYYFDSTSQGYLDVIHTAAPGTYDNPYSPASIISSSLFFSFGDDDDTLNAEAAAQPGAGLSKSNLQAISAAFQDAAIGGHTVCVTSGDYGAVGVGNNSNPFDLPNTARVNYPAGDPNVTCFGGTTLNSSSIGSPINTETVWNDSSGATGGGISALFTVPDYQSNIHLPASLNSAYRNFKGRGIPDVAGNASGNSGYKMFFSDSTTTYNVTPVGGTSIVAPLYAGLFAIINATLGRNIGFINPILYKLGSLVCNDVNPIVVGGPNNNIYPNSGIGYTAGSGWDACTGLGSIDGTKLLHALYIGIPTLFPVDTNGIFIITRFSSSALPIILSQTTSDLVCVKPNSPSLSKVSLEVAARNNDYTTAIYQANTRFNTNQYPNAIWSMFQLKGNVPPQPHPSLVLINLSPSGRLPHTNNVTISIDEPLLNYQSTIGLNDAPTMFTGNPGTYLITDFDGDGFPDLAQIDLSSSMVKITIASAATNYLAAIPAINNLTTAMPNMGSGVFLMADYDEDGIPDLIFLNTGSTASGQVEISIASGASKYKKLIVSKKPTVFPTWLASDGTWQMVDAYKETPIIIQDTTIHPSPRQVISPSILCFIRTHNTFSGKVEVFFASAEYDFLRLGSMS